MIKMVMLLKRKRGMSLEEFRADYEETHARIGERYFKGSAVRYFRRYLQVEVGGGDVPEPDYDVLTEVWFPNDEAFARSRKQREPAEAQAELRAEEERLFEPGRLRFFVVEECESDMSAG